MPGFVVASMPHYYFHRRDGDSIQRDEAGLTLPDREAAWYQAARSACDLIRAEHVPGAAWDGQAIEIADSAGEAISRIFLEDIAGYAV
jgi:hypothetical protein